MNDEDNTQLIPPPPMPVTEPGPGVADVVRDLILAVEKANAAAHLAASTNARCKESILALEASRAAMNACRALERKMDLSRTHSLKCDPGPFQDVFEGRKTFEVRYFDRDYRVGDCLLLSEFDREMRRYSGRQLVARIVYILEPMSYGLPQNVGVLGISLEEVQVP